MKFINQIISIVVLLLLTFPVSSKPSKIVIRGVVFCEKEPIPFASVALYSVNKAELLGGAISDETGKYNIQTSYHKGYVLVISSIGYQKREIVIEKITPIINQAIQLKRTVTDLGEVQVKASAIQNKIDRDVITVTKQMRQGAPTTSYLLRKSPGIDVDYVNESITVDGNSNVLLMVDGSRIDARYIKNLPSKRIEKMEIFREANGRYAMEGYNAVINIILKKNYRGFSSNIEDTEVFSTNDNNGSHFKYFSTQNIQADYTQDKLLVYATGVRYDQSSYDTMGDQFVFGRKKIISMNSDSKNYNQNNNVGFLTGKVGFDYKLSSKQTLGVQYSYNSKPDDDNIKTSDYTRSVYDDLEDKTPSSSYKMFDEIKNKENSHSFQTILKTELSDRSKLNIEGYYNLSNSINTTTFINSNQNTGTNQKIDKRSDYLKTVIEYDHKIGKKGNLALGYNYIWKLLNDSVNSSFLSNTGLPVNVSDYSSTVTVYDRKEMYHRVYGNLNFPLSKKLVAGFGYGVEWNKLGDVNSYQVQHLPYARVMYKPNTKLSFVLNYKVNTHNPYRSQTLDYKRPVDEYEAYLGNADLEGYSTHRVDLAISMFGNKLRITPYYSNSKGTITQWGLGLEEVDGQKRYVYSYINADKYDRMGVVFSSNIRFTKKLNFSIMGSYNHYKIGYQDITKEEDALVYRAQLVYSLRKYGLVFGAIYKNNLQKEPLLMGYSMKGNDHLACLVMKNWRKSGLFLMAYYGIPAEGDLFDYSIDNKWIDDRPDIHYQRKHSMSTAVLKGIGMVKIGWRFNKGKTHKKMKRQDLEEKKEITNSTVF
ncbi:outer membrane beta-barrel protein [Halosquirtibacter laminarini]|uniref:Outer membrane beta-barrel protein n=1 Tax=Halosquirtibacter laminarini TaxID=3374600 RepID=A0AC61NDJ3_9BACT|nr:outer membrane beta-barrel protein [Prolixibacteraceae bacterium]